MKSWAEFVRVFRQQSNTAGIMANLVYGGNILLMSALWAILHNTYRNVNRQNAHSAVYSKSVLFNQTSTSSSLSENI